jgi:predicted ribosomally synthesized peptide with nif11-like leader
MAITDAMEFLAFVDTDVTLQGMLNVVSWNPHDTAEIAAARGFRVTSDELQVVIEDTWGDLLEEDLRHVAGGDPGGNSGHDNPPPGHNDDRDNGWAPPPGDVSGRSCFFGRRG